MPNDSPDLSFYTRLRHSGTAEEIIRRYAEALRRLTSRQIEDLRTGKRGEFSGDPDPVLSALADGLERVQGHIDAFEAAALSSSGNVERDSTVRNILANVIGDANASAVAEAHVSAPKAKEGKFDQEEGGILQGSLSDVADKLWHMTELVGAELGFLINLIAVILRDIGLFGKPASGASLTEVGRQLENKLDFVIPQLGDLGSTARLVNQTVSTTAAEVNKIELKADALASLLGHTLVGAQWVVDPSQPGFTSNKLPPKDIKGELHDIEKRLIENCDIIENPPDDGNGNGKGSHDAPRHELVPVLRDRRLKKIFVYAENTFTPNASTDRRKIRVQTPAFDLSGWLDLSRLRSGDVVEVEVKVSFANRRDVLFSRTAFNKKALVPFADFARSLNYLSGSNILIALRQKASADNFRTPIELAYQLIVESV